MCCQDGPSTQIHFNKVGLQGYQPGVTFGVIPYGSHSESLRPEYSNTVTLVAPASQHKHTSH